MALTPDQQRRMRVRRMNLLMAYASFASSKAVAWTPAELFAQGEQGVWYDPSDMTTLFQDSAGTTPVTAVEQPVGLIQDKSGNGNHASQSTSASRPVLSARVNLLTHTEAFDNAAWVKELGPTVTANASTAPNGTLTADEYFPTQSTSRLRQGANVLSGQPYIFSIYAKEVTNSVLSVESAVIAGFSMTFFNLATGTVTSGQAGSTIVSVGSGWYRCSIPFTPSTSGSMNFRVGSYYNTSGSILIWGADLRVANDGVNLPAYQRVGAATAGTSTTAGNADYDTTGFPMYLRFDGTDDGMATGTINPGSVDKAQVFAGVRKLSDAATQVVVELSTSWAANSGALAFFAGSNAAGTPGDFYRLSSHGVSTVSNTESGVASGYAAPITNVVAATADISGDLTTIRVNGTAGTSGTGDQGSGNYLSYPLYIGRRGGTANPFNGQLYSLIVRFSATNLPDATIAQTETWVNGKTRAY